MTDQTNSPNIGQSSKNQLLNSYLNSPDTGQSSNIKVDVFSYNRRPEEYPEPMAQISVINSLSEYIISVGDIHSPKALQSILVDTLQTALKQDPLNYVSINLSEPMYYNCDVHRISKHIAKLMNTIKIGGGQV